ncbi:Ubiquitin-like-specific protease 2 [Colletotrichum spinosum]|uniref:Ubiquitin-like-specific protease 2 n=1 Tax=Colletotrichum spinosum TaxID=1347390 RepID=A0A4R8Q4X4_9PEZI|nr:Ubiquitin-like-specific protease 2 [Colletotrichum spinosum]
MSAATARMRGVLAGNFTVKSDINSTGLGDQNKRPARTTDAGAGRSIKRQKTAPKHERQPTAAYSKARFMLPPSSASPTLVDLTESQKSTDVEVISNHSNRESVTGSAQPEFRAVEKANDFGQQRRQRRRPLTSKDSATKSTSPDHIALDDDDLGKANPDHNSSVRGAKVGSKKANKRYLKRLQPREGISDDDELHSLEGSSQTPSKRLRLEVDPICEFDETKSPITPGSRQARGDITRVKFTPSSTKPQGQKPVFRLKRAVSGNTDLKKIFDKQWDNAVNFRPNRRCQPDDIRLPLHNESENSKNDSQVSSGSTTRSPQQRSPYHSSASLRDGMKADSSTSTPGIDTKRTSSRTARVEEQGKQTELRATRELPPRQTREAASRQLSNSRPKLSPSPIPWTQRNPDWEQIWDDRPLIFPATGKNRASVYKDDILRLEEGEFMNDNLIAFYSRYLQTKLEQENPDLANRIYFMNTYFYPKLTEKSGRGINYDGVKSWTAKVDIFSYDYIIVPVNELAHWYLAIICHPSKMVEVEEANAKAQQPTDMQEPLKDGLVASVRKQVKQMSLDEMDTTEDGPETVSKDSNAPPLKPQRQRPADLKSSRQDPNRARVITFDSLGTPHTATCRNLKEYLVRELKDKKNIDVERPTQFGMTAKGIPEQLDYASCGAFLLGYLREFLRNPDDVVSRLIRKETSDWNITSINMRGELRDLIMQHRKEQNEGQSKEKKPKRKTNVQVRTASKSPAKSASGLPATPEPYKPAGDLPKIRSSTVKGSPQPCHIDLSSPIKKAVQSPVKKTTESPAQQVADSSGKLSAKEYQSDLDNISQESTRHATLPLAEPLLASVESSLSSRLETPASSLLHTQASTSPVRPSPNNSVVNGNASGNLRLLEPLQSSSSQGKPTREDEASDRAGKVETPSEMLLDELPPTSPREEFEAFVRTGRVYNASETMLLNELPPSSPPKLSYRPSERSDGSKSSPSPSQQLEIEMTGNFSEEKAKETVAKKFLKIAQNRKKKPTSDDVVKRRTRAAAQGSSPHTSPYFAITRSTRSKSSPTLTKNSSPASTKKPSSRQLSITEVMKPRQSIEDAGTNEDHPQEENAKQTVDLTAN